MSDPRFQESKQPSLLRQEPLWLRRPARRQDSHLHGVISRVPERVDAAPSRTVRDALPQGTEKDRNRAEKTHFYHFVLFRFSIQCL